MSKTSKKSTQDFVPIREIRDGVVLLKDGGMRGVFMASSLNFALKSADEQQAVLLQFQNFINSLDFSIQFYIQSRDLDIRPYVAILEDIYTKQSNDLMKIQTREYISFVKEFTENTNVMTKTFYVVVPYSPSVVEKKTGVAGIAGLFKFGKKSKSKSLDDEAFEEYRIQLGQRMAVVEQGLVRTGVRLIQLGTEELIELYYKIFNPGDLEKPMKLQ